MKPQLTTGIIEHTFTTEPPAPPDWLHDDPDTPAPTMGTTAPSGIFALELDIATTDVGALPDAELVDAAIGFEHLAAWATARQAAVLAEFTRRDSASSLDAPTTTAAAAERGWAADEIAMALTVSRGSAHARLDRATRLDGPLRPTRDLLETGRLDASRARLICDRTTTLDDAMAAAVQDRVLPRAPGQTWAQLDAALRRAILAADTPTAPRDGTAPRRPPAGSRCSPTTTGWPPCGRA